MAQAGMIAPARRELMCRCFVITTQPERLQRQEGFLLEEELESV